MLDLITDVRGAATPDEFFARLKGALEDICPGITLHPIFSPPTIYVGSKFKKMLNMIDAVLCNKYGLVLHSEDISYNRMYITKDIDTAITDEENGMSKYKSMQRDIENISSMFRRNVTPVAQDPFIRLEFSPVEDDYHDYPLLITHDDNNCNDIIIAAIRSGVLKTAGERGIFTEKYIIRPTDNIRGLRALITYLGLTRAVKLLSTDVAGEYLLEITSACFEQPCALKASDADCDLVITCMEQLLPLYEKKGDKVVFNLAAYQALLGINPTIKEVMEESKLFILKNFRSADSPELCLYTRELDGATKSFVSLVVAPIVLLSIFAYSVALEKNEDGSTTYTVICNLRDKRINRLFQLLSNRWGIVKEPARIVPNHNEYSTDEVYSLSTFTVTLYE